MPNGSHELTAWTLNNKSVAIWSHPLGQKHTQTYENNGGNFSEAHNRRYITFIYTHTKMSIEHRATGRTERQENDGINVSGGKLHDAYGE